MLGLTPDQQAHLFQTAFTSLVLVTSLALAWLEHSYRIRGWIKRARCHL
jgi:hypothetical protein